MASPGKDAKTTDQGALLKTLGDSVLVAQTLLGHLVKWRLAGPAGAAFGWLLAKESQVATMTSVERAQWAPCSRRSRSASDASRSG